MAPSTTYTCDICGTPVAARTSVVHLRKDGRAIHKQCFFSRDRHIWRSFNAAKRWLEDQAATIVDEASLRYRFVDAQEMEVIFFKTFEPTPGYDPSSAVGVYSRWIPNVRPFVVLTACMVGAVIISLVGMRLGGPQGLLLGVVSFLGLLFVISLLKVWLNVRAGHEIRILSGHDSTGTEEILVHELAHYIHNRRTISAVWHQITDYLMYPLLVSYTEGLATWAGCVYLSNQKGRNIDVGSMPIHYRNGYRLTRMIESSLGPDAVWFLLKYV